MIVCLYWAVSGEIDPIMKIDRSDIVNKVHDRFNGEISKLLLDDAMAIVCDFVGDSLLKDRSIHVHNFGTIHTFILSGHLGRNISSGELQYVKPKRHAKFLPHVTFSKLLEEKKDGFRQNNS